MAKRICELCDALPWGKTAERRCICHGVNLDLGCGPHKNKGFVGTDIRDVKGVDLVFDLETFPWPIPDSCVDKLLASHILEHIKPWKSIDLWNEMWRVMKRDSQLLVSVPHGRSNGYIQDPTHCSPYNEATFAYYQPGHESNLWTIYRPKPWRVMNMKSSEVANIEAIIEPIKECPHGRAFDPDMHLVGLIARCQCCVNIFPTKFIKQKPGPQPAILCRPCKQPTKRGRS